MFLVVIGTLKSKYMFLATPFLLMALIKKEKVEGLIFNNKKLPVKMFVVIFGIGWMISGVNLAPTQMDLQEMNKAIQLAKDNNMVLLNDWGNGWAFQYLDYNTNYKSSYPNPDYNNYPRPFVAYTIEKIPLCERVASKTVICK